MRPISFFTPISFENLPKKTKTQHFIQAVDGYLYLKGMKAYVIDAAVVNRSRSAIILHPQSRSKILLAIKIASYVIFMLPIIALITKTFTRSIHRFHLHEHPRISIKPFPSPSSEPPRFVPLTAPMSKPLPQDNLIAEHPVQLPKKTVASARKITSEKSRSVEIFLTTDAGNPAGVVEAGRQKKITEMGFSRVNFSAEAAVKKITLSQEVRQVAEGLKAKFSIPKSLLSDLRNRRPKIADIKSMLELGREMDHSARALQHHLSLFKGESRTIKRAQVMLEELREQIETASHTIKNKKLASLYDCWATSLFLEGLFLGKKQAAIDSVSEMIEEYIRHLDGIIHESI